MAKGRDYRIMLFANDDSSRTKGLMHTDPIPEDHCAFFIFPRVADHSFWNHNVSYPLSIAFCDSNLRVLAIREMEAMSRDSCHADNQAVKYVIETIRGAMDDVSVGDRLVVDPDTMTLSFES
jgi:uncharacterized membrane protein (UPF0127 family)